jgi:hypothetical protein
MTTLPAIVTDAENAAISAAGPVVQSAVEKLLAKISTDATTKDDVDQFVVLGLKIGAELLAPLASKALTTLAGKVGITISA